MCDPPFIEENITGNLFMLGTTPKHYLSIEKFRKMWQKVRPNLNITLFWNKIVPTSSKLFRHVRD